MDFSGFLTQPNVGGLSSPPHEFTQRKGSIPTFLSTFSRTLEWVLEVLGRSSYLEDHPGDLYEHDCLLLLGRANDFWLLEGVFYTFYTAEHDQCGS